MNEYSSNETSLHDAVAESIRRYVEMASDCPHAGTDRFCECFGYSSLTELMQPLLDAVGPLQMSSTAGSVTDG